MKNKVLYKHGIFFLFFLFLFILPILVSQSVSADTPPVDVLPAVGYLYGRPNISTYIIGRRTTNNSIFAYYFSSAFDVCINSSSNTSLIMFNCSSDPNAKGDYWFRGNDGVFYGADTNISNGSYMAVNINEVEILYSNVPDFPAVANCPTCPTLDSVIAKSIYSLAAVLIVLSFFRLILNMYMGVRR